MKICPKCDTLKKAKDFYKQNDRSSGASYCKKCFNQLCIERWKQKKKDAIKKLGGKCTDCKKIYHPNVYDFHHLHNKDYSWNKLRLLSQKTIDAELSKCVLLCANCHRLRHVE